MHPQQTVVPLTVADISLFCKNLRQHLIDKQASAPPGHLALLNLLAKSAGHRNYQALRAQAALGATTPAPQPIELPRDTALPKVVLRALGQFDTHGRLVRFPTLLSVRLIALWGLWCRLPASRNLTEAQVNQTIAQFHTFDDNATLRRELVNAKLLWRTRDGSQYRKVAQRPSPEASDFLRALHRATLQTNR